MIVLYFFVVVASILSGLQTGSNATFNKQIHNAPLASIVENLVSFLTLLLVYAAYVAVTRHGWAQPQQWRAIPWWSWIGGAMSAAYTISMFAVAEKVSAGLFIVLSVTTATLTSIAMDHFALMGYSQHTAGPGRLIGAALMVAGLVCIARF